MSTNVIQYLPKRSLRIPLHFCS